MTIQTCVTVRIARIAGLSAIAALAALALSGCGQVGSQIASSSLVPSEPARPNIIVIIADDLGYADISANGGKIATPHIDELATSGVRMTNGYVTAAVCAPSRSGLMSGRTQTRFGYEFNPVGRDETNGMAQTETTIAQTLKGAGYRTGMVGKWHIGQASGFHPLDRGFDSFYGVLGGATPYLRTIGPGDLHVVTAEDDRITRERLPIFDGRTPQEPDEYVTDLFTDRAIRFIDGSRSQPFFLYLAYTAPHTPLQAPKSYLDRVSRDGTDYDRVYRAMMLALDEGVGRLREHLKETGQLDNTLIFFLSDNGCPSYVGGACSNGPLNSWKGYPWDGGVRVPYIASWPARLAPGVIHQPVSSLDIAATAAAVAGARHPGAEGVDLIDMIKNPEQLNARGLFWRMGPTHIVRKGRWKLLIVNRAEDAGPAGGDDLGRSLRPEGAPAAVSALGQWTLLYDMQSDPGETTNLAEVHPEIVEALSRDWAGWNSGNVEPQWTSRRGVNNVVNGMRVELFN